MKSEIKEGLDCEVDVKSLDSIGEYTDAAAGKPDKEISIKLYSGKIFGIPKPSAEVKKLHWIGKKDADNPQVSRIIRNKIIPDLAKRKILK